MTNDPRCDDEMMNLFMLRQTPFGDKVLQNKNILRAYVSHAICEKRIVPIPYLHNMSILHAIGIQDGMSAGEIADLIRNSTTHLLDEHPAKRNQKKARLVQLLSNLHNVYVLIPKEDEWIVAKCKEQPVIRHIENVLFADRKLIACHDYHSTQAHPRGVDLSFVLGLEIEFFRILPKPKETRLPPISIQRIYNATIVKNICDLCKEDGHHGREQGEAERNNTG